ncbi:hypothetical protein Ddc_13305 [Ditylenchus destructor]|nr:hypothetical protein Ddc_13305 [Ditylenchus destructor]
MVWCADDQGRLSENECKDEWGFKHECSELGCIPTCAYGRCERKPFTCDEPSPVVLVKVKHENEEIPPDLEVYSASGKVNGSRFWDLLIDKLLADSYQPVRDLSVKLVAIYTDPNKTDQIENSQKEYSIPTELYLDTTTGVKTIDVIMEAKIPVGTFARPSDILRVFMDKADSYKMKVLKGNVSNSNVDENKLELTANMDKIVKKN